MSRLVAKCRGWLWWFALAVSSVTAAPLAVELPSLDQRDGRAVTLPAQWYPAALGSADSAPAVLLLHGCGGLWTRDRRRLDGRFHEMATRLNAMGIHALALDSLTPRGETDICTQKMGTRAVTQANRRLDALGALAWLSVQPSVDARRLGLVGWSHGGSTVLAASNGQHAEVRRAAVRASLAVAFYPGCETDRRRGYEATAPLLILIGADDDWTPAQPCQDLAAAARGAPVSLEIYAGAYHGFDGQSPVRLRRDVPNGTRPGEGVHVGAHPPSREAARQRLAEFFKTHWTLP